MSFDDSSRLQQRHALMRRIVAAVVVLSLLIALIYDVTIARRNVRRADQRISDQSAEVDATGGRGMTKKDIRQLLEMTPTRVFRDGTDDVDVFHWGSGVPLRTYKLYVVFDMEGEKPRYVRHSSFAYQPNSAQPESDYFAVLTGSESEANAIANEEPGADDDQPAEPIGNSAAESAPGNPSPPPE